MAPDNVISFEQSADGARRRLADARLTPVVASVRGKLEETLPRLMQDLFEHLDDDLYQLADKSSSDGLQSQYFEAMREMRKLRSSIEKDFLSGRLKAFDSFWSRRPAQPAGASESQSNELQLLDEAELEENLAVSSMVSKSENRFHRELFAINMRFTEMLGGVEIDNAANPVGPKALVEGFADTLAAWRGETAVRLLVFKLFERYVMAYIGGLYDDINDALVSAGILPKVVQRVRRNPVAPSVQRARDPRHDTAEPSFAEGSPESGEVLSMLGQLLAARRGSDSAGSGLRWSFAEGATQHLPEVSTNDLISALSAVQQSSLQAAPVDLGEMQNLQVQLVDNLGRELDLGPEGRRTRRLGREDQDVLDIMEMLFDFILGDDNLPEAMKALLGRLQIPLLKVAVLDRTFFNNRQHPARRLLNTLARAGVAWTDDGDRSANSAYGQIETAVTRILTQFDNDPALFEQVLEDFSQYLERERRGAEIAEERVGQVKRGQEQLELARRRVAEVIQEHLLQCQPPGCVVPEAVVQLIDEAWRDALLLAYLREGEQSDAWKSANELLETLLWSVQPKNSQMERQKLLKMIPDLLKRLREGLVNISFDQHRASQLFKELQACHIAALRGTRVDVAESQAVVPDESVILESAPEPEVQDDRYQQAADALAVGQWLEWEREDGNWVRGKLSWRSEVTGNCIFVSRKGAKLAEMSLPAIAAKLRSDSARVLQDVEKPLMDRALNAMLDALQRTGQRPSPNPA